MEDPEIPPCVAQLRPRAERGLTCSAGLSGVHHFCFATYQRPDRLEWGALRTLSDFRLEQGAIRPPSFHSGFDVVTVVVKGRMRRTGTYNPRQELGAGSIELISTGRGVHLGLETKGDEPALFTEIWLKTGPGRREPRRDWRPTAMCGLDHPFADHPFAAGDPAEPPSLSLRASARLQNVSLIKGSHKEIRLAANDCAYLALEAGALFANGINAEAGDGLAIAGPGSLHLSVHETARFLLIRTSKII